MNKPQLHSYYFIAFCMIVPHIIDAKSSINLSLDKLLNRTIHEDIVHKEYPLKGRKTIFIKNLRGTITVKSEWNNQTLLMTATKKASKPEYLDLLTIDDSQSDKNSIKIETICDPNNKKAAKTSIDYVFVVPANVRLELVCENGNIIVNEVNGHIVAKTCKTGDIEIDNAQSSIFAQTELNGSIIINQAHHNVKAFANKGNITILNAKKGIIAQADKGKLDIECLSVPNTSKVSLNTHSGNITLRIPKSTSAELHAHTEKGMLTCAHYVTVKPMTTQLNANAWTQFKRQVNGTLGSGGPDINLHVTKNGDIKIIDVAA
jgi:DUF4097 and DUF4098 domain-containing protein YvlB